MRVADVTKGVEITTIADLPAGIGLASSSVLTVGVLNALFAYRGQFVPAGELAALACKIEIDVLGRPIGKQDQYIAAHGGFQFVRFYGDERVTVEPMYCRPETAQAVVEQLLLFYTGMTRAAGSVLAQAKKRMTTRTSTQDALDALVGDRRGAAGPGRRQRRHRHRPGAARRLAAQEADGHACLLVAARRLLRPRPQGRGHRRQDRRRRRRRLPAAGRCRPRRAASVRRAMAKCGLREIPFALEPGGTTIIHASDWERPGGAANSGRAAAPRGVAAPGAAGGPASPRRRRRSGRSGSDAARGSARPGP